ncbi:heavy metal translocating P-type ATPase [Microvirga sp. W0021]|uniref:P-type Zn(2+) transporter n=1 Tax=Hohaiivirga grylli TaxID=3133970 RepID=A0ABV0BHD0_9HYPH
MTRENQKTDMNTEKTSFFKVAGLDCGSCAMKIEASLSKLSGVSTVDTSITTELVTVHHRPDVSMTSLATKLDTLGYKVLSMSNKRDDLSATAVPSMQTKEQATPADDHSNCSGHDHGAGHKHSHDGEKSDHVHDEDDDHIDHTHDHSDDRPWWKKTDGILVLVCSAFIVASYLIGTISPTGQTVALLAGAFIGLVPVAFKAWRGIRQGFPFSIETLMVVAAVGAIFIGAIDEAAVVVVLFMIGELLESIASGQARRGIKGLTDLIPKISFLEKNGSLVETPISNLKIGDVIVARPGDRISADGEILSGSSSIDESPVTGESAPKTKNPGDQVFAGSINHDAALRIRVSNDPGNNTIARIAKLVEEAQDRKSPTQRFINRFSQVYTPFIFLIGLSVAVIPPMFGADLQTWIYRGLAVLLIGCPCALVISTPAAIASGIAAGAKRGLLLKGGEVLEKLATVTTVAFDKTGTLTTGVPSVTDIKGFGRSEADAVVLAASVEASSSHPLAKAIINQAKTRELSLKVCEDAGVIAGKGVTGRIDGQDIFVGSPKSAAEFATISSEQNSFIESLFSEGKTVAVLVVNGSLAGVIGLRDEPKTDAAEGISALKDNNIRALMLTGDHKATATAIAGQLGIEVRSELLPQDKMKIVASLQAEGQSVAKVGDGINDAPALAAADVGIAMAGGLGGGTDIALETGDAAILQGQVMGVARLIDLAKRTMRNIRQNLTIALGLKAVFLVTTVMGITGLWPAILADTGATLLVTANALRLLRMK